MDNNLQHYGIPGMKWGFRRFQNSDGSLTNAGRNRYANPNSQQARRDYWLKQNQKGGKDKPNVSRAEIFGRKGVDIAEGAKNGLSAASRLKKPKEHSELSKMSNKEIQAAINRMNLERQYASLSDGDIRNGFDIARDILDIFGSTVAVGTAAVGLYSIIKNVPK